MHETLPEISVIVPVFNVENFLRKCIDSILSQTLKKIELILVDDGSSDNSGKICEEYARADGRVHVIHQENMGRVAARKRGLEKAVSDYVMFCDSDDWIDSNMCEELLKPAVSHGACLVTSGCINEDGGPCMQAADAYPEGFYGTEADMEYLRVNSFMYHGTDRWGFLPSVCTKLYRTSLAREAMNRVPEEVYRGEDLLFNHLYLMNCKSVYVSRNAYYHYRIHNDSTVHMPAPDFMLQIGLREKILQEAVLKIADREEYLRGLHIRTFLDFLRLWNENRKEMHVPYYCFRMDALGKGNIVLYGAGKVGMDYYEQLRKLMPGKVTLWIDRAYQNYCGKYKVEPVETIRTADFEQVVIAVRSEETAEEIRGCLTAEYGVPDEKIIWQEPDCFWI